MKAARSGRLASTRLALALALAATVAASVAAWWSRGADRYVATAEILVAPVADESAYRGLPVFRSTGADDDRSARTAARLVESAPVADEVAVRLGFESREAALDTVEARADPGSDVVEVRARASQALRSAQIANAFAETFVSIRSQRFQSAVALELRRVREQLLDVPAGRRDEEPALTLAQRVAELRALEGTRDPTVEIAGTAVAPAAPLGRPVWPAAAAAFLAGLAIALLLVKAAGPCERPGLRRSREAQPPVPAEPVATPDQVLTRAAAAPAEPAARGRSAEQSPPRRHSPSASAARAPVGYNVERLERLVATHGAAYPELLPEWEGYLFHLRGHAGADGRLPRNFDYLIEESFAPLLDADAAGSASGAAGERRT